MTTNPKMTLTNKTVVLPPIYIVGGGSMAQKLAQILFRHHVAFCFIDELTSGPLLKKTVLRAAELSAPDGIFLIAISIPEYANAALERLKKQHVSSSQCLHFPFDSTLMLFATMLEQSFQQLWQLLQQPIKNFVAVEQTFYASQWQQLQQKRSAQKRLGFYRLGRGGGYLEHLAKLPLLLADQFDCLMLSDAQNQVSSTLPQVLMSQAAMLEFNNIDLVITAHVFPCSPPTVKKLSFVHMVYDFLLFSAQTYEHIAQADTHYIVVPSQPSLLLHQQIYHQQNMTNNVVLIPGGYPRHDVNLQRYAEIEKTEPDCSAIMYAPTLSSLTAANETDSCFSILQATQFIPQLLLDFPDSRIIFRPHPEDLALAHLELPHPRARAFRELLAFCEAHPRCTVDRNKSCYLEAFARSKVLITDMSSVAFSFGLLTNRAVIFYAENHQSLVQDYPNCQFIHDRQYFGVCVSSIAALKQQVSAAFSARGVAMRNAEFCKNLIFNLGQSEQYILDNMSYILDDKPHPDWVYLQPTTETFL